MNAIFFKESLWLHLLIFVTVSDCGHFLQLAVSLATLHFDMSKLRESALPGTSFSLLPSSPSVTALADLHTPHKLYNHFHFSPDMMCLTPVNFLVIYCELDAFLCSVLPLVRRCESVRLPCDYSRRVVASGASGAVCSPNPSLFLGCRGHKGLQRCYAAGLKLQPCLPSILRCPEDSYSLVILCI